MFDENRVRTSYRIITYNGNKMIVSNQYDDAGVLIDYATSEYEDLPTNLSHGDMMWVAFVSIM